MVSVAMWIALTSREKKETKNLGAVIWVLVLTTFPPLGFPPLM